MCISGSLACLSYEGHDSICLEEYIWRKKYLLRKAKPDKQKI